MKAVVQTSSTQQQGVSSRWFEFHQSLNEMMVLRGRGGSGLNIVSHIKLHTATFSEGRRSSGSG